MPKIESDEYYMQCALDEAKCGYEKDEVPVGAVLVRDNEILSSAHNVSVHTHDPSAHAEIMAIRKASEKAGNYRLTGTTLYVTLEPCVMCAGAIIQARIGRLVFGAPDPKGGAVVSLFSILDDIRLNHQVAVSGGILKVECGEILSRFFREKRILSPPV